MAILKWQYELKKSKNVMYMADSDPERGENVGVLMPIDYLGNIRNIIKGPKYYEINLKFRKGLEHLKNNQTVVNIAYNAKQMCSKACVNCTKDSDRVLQILIVQKLW